MRNSGLGQTGSKSGKEYVKAVYCHRAYLTYMQSTSYKMLGWMKHKLESRFLGEISITSCIQMSEWVSEVAQSCPTLCDPVDCSPPDSSIHGILQARILEWVAIFFSRESSQPRDRTQVSHIAGRRFNLWATREALYSDDTTLIAECKKELKGLWWRWKRRVKNLV